MAEVKEVDRAAFDELAGAVATLTQAVEDGRKGKADQETVDRIAAVVLEKQAAAAKETNNADLDEHGNPKERQSYRPEDVAGGDGSHLPKSKRLPKSGVPLLQSIQTRPAKHVARALKRDVGDVEAFQQACDGVAILAAICEAYEGRGELPVTVQETNYYRDEFKPLLQAMDTATAAEGLEWVPKELSASLIERVNLDLMVAALIPTIEMPTNPFDIPGRGVTRQRLGKATEQTADTGQTGFKKITPATRKVTLTAAKFAGEALVSKEAEEDAIVAMLPLIIEELADYMAADLEDAILNGDTAGTMDTGWASDDPRKNFDGLRKSAAAGAKSDEGNVAPTVVLTSRVNRKKMGVYGIRPPELVHITSMAAYIALLGDANVLTMEKYGPNATIVAGELAKIDGSPLIVSEYIRNDLNATGVFDNVTTTRTELLTLNRRGYLLGNRRGLTLQVLRELYAEYDQDAVICAHRKAFTSRFPTATQFTVGISYNIPS